MPSKPRIPGRKSGLLPEVHRTLLMSANSMGVLRKALIDTFGMQHARDIFMRAGYACGVEDTMTLRKQVRFDSDLECIEAWPRLHTRTNQVRIEPLEARLDRGTGDFLVRARWHDSYEAEQHRLYLDQAREPTCWFLSGYASGWCTAVLGEKTLCVELQCAGKGAPCCEVEIRRVAQWGERARASVFDIGEALREHRLALTLYEAFRQSNDVMFYCDRNGTIIDVNLAFSKVYGFSREEAVGKTPGILRSGHSTQEMYESMWGRITTEGHWRGQLINKAKDGREIPVVLTITAVRDAGGDILGYVSNAADVTETLALQSRVAHSEALAGLGEMAAVMAHEIRNPLSSIVMAAKQLAESKLGDKDRRMVFGVLRDESRRLNETLTSFLAFARPRELKLARADLNVLVSETLRILKSDVELLRGIKTKTTLDRSLEPFPMDADQLRQVAWNVLLNAVQAMGKGGVLSVETGRRDGRHYLRVSDTGPGIPEKERASIFKPFFTTKRQGTGLGLATADRIVKAHGGRIEVESRPEQGTSFCIYLPVVQS